MPRGGRRENAGRKVGAKTKLTRKAAVALNASGKTTPLEALDIVMQFYLRRFKTEIKKGAKGNPDDVAAAAEAVRKAASDAAPYRHAKLAAIQHTGKDNGPIQLVDLSKLSDEQLAALEPVIAALAAADDVVDANPDGEG